MADLHVSVEGLDELDHVTEALSEEERDLPDDLHKAIRDKARDLAQQARDKVLGEPIHGIKQTGLRAKMAAGTTVEDTDDGASVVVEPDGEDARLPADMDEGGWSHPVFGNRNNWVTQNGYFSWFTETMDEGDELIENALEDVLDQAAERIAGA